MAFAGSPASSVGYAKYAAHDLVDSRDWGGKVRAWFEKYTHSLGAGTGEVNMIRMEPGKRRILVDSCRIVTTAFASGAQIHIGFREYTKHDGTVVPQDDNAFLDNEVVTAAVDRVWGLPAEGYFEVDSRTDFSIYCMVDTANIEDTDTITLICVAMEGN